jgi:hypothetical protein
VLEKRRNTMTVYRFSFNFAAAPLAAVVLMMASGGSAWAGGPAYTCSSPGSIPAGVYSSLTISSACAIDAGSVTVEGNVTVLAGASLVAYSGGSSVAVPPVFPSNLVVTGNFAVQAGALVALGCEPIFFVCPNDPAYPVPGANGTYETLHTIGGNLTAENALAVVIHKTSVGGDITLYGSSAGVNSCTESLPLLGFAPPYGDLEDMVIGGNVVISGFDTCWLGWFRDTVKGNVNLFSSVNGDPDGNEIGDSIVLGNLSCAGNSPSNQHGDSGTGPVIVVGSATGQCAIVSGDLTGLFVTNDGGTGYTSPPTVKFSGGGGSGAAATAIVVGGSVIGFIITNPGTGYSSAPTVSIMGGGGSGATAQAVVTQLVEH